MRLPGSLAGVLLACAAFAAPAPGFAQPAPPPEGERPVVDPLGATPTDFNGAAVRAERVEEDLVSLAGPFFDPCDLGSPAMMESCRGRRDARQAALRRRSWRIALPGADLVQVGPYERVREAMAVRVEGLAFASPRGVVATRPYLDGRMPAHLVAERIQVVAPGQAEAWLAAHPREELRLDLVFRFGEAFQDGLRRGVTMVVEAVRVVSVASGEELLDSLADGTPEEGPALLTERVMVWEPGRLREVRWTAPDGTGVLFGAEVASRADGTRSVSLTWSRAVRVAVLRPFDAPSADASLALAPRGRSGIIAIFTERRPTRRRAGSGETHLFVWEAGSLVHRATWRGSNRSRPPRWLVDPDAPLPDP
ncbi:MAG: hypothetical protein AAF447_08225 [Myxococcota bacterium]